MRTVKILPVILLLVLTAVNKSNAQNSNDKNLPGVVNSAGGYSRLNNQLYDFSIGELVLTETFTGVPQFVFTQGFLQPFFMTIIPIPDDVLIANNVVTPNGDGKNDFFVIKGLENYPGNKVSIFDRSGRLIFSAVDYKNTFDGTYNGNKLHENAYYYVIDLGKNRALIKGSVTVILDTY